MSTDMELASPCKGDNCTNFLTSRAEFLRGFCDPCAQEVYDLNKIFQLEKENAELKAEIDRLVFALEGCVEIFNDAKIAVTHKALCQKTLSELNQRGKGGM